MSDVPALLGEFLTDELPHGPIDIGPNPTLAAVGTLAAVALANPLLREPLAQARTEPAAYLAFPTMEDLLGSEAWRLALVISPFKREVARHCTAMAPAAAATGVVDTVVRVNGALLGINTNAYAAGETLRRMPTGPREPLLLVGTGASARSVAFAVQRWLAGTRLGIYGRSTERALDLAHTFGAEIVEHPANFGASVVVHATTVGEQDDSRTIGAAVEAALTPGVRVLDLTNRLTALQVLALANGCLVQSGMLMQRLTNTLRVACISHTFN